MDTSLALDKQLSVDRLLKWRKVRVLHSRGNPNIGITECFLVGRINPNKVTNTVMQYLHLNLNQDIHMEKLYMMTLQIAFFQIGPSG